MLELYNIRKEYIVGDNVTVALDDLSLKFRHNEFVSILGPSGCGKTTLLNIIGGLDRYTSGDLVINGKSTKEYKDRDWDIYRNHTIGFVFQTYNLIMHLNVYENVELALTLSGISEAERKEKVLNVLSRVGLDDKIYSLPNQLSGGQMQRVAIARALVNNPDILLADEPTGALDSGTSIQIMDLLKEIAKEKLVVMVTHNPELAEEYSTRIIKIKDGRLIDDSMPVEELHVEEKPLNNKKTSMSFFTALKLSFRNLLTKKTRTLLVALAGSIGIIGIALIMSMSHGFQSYIDRIQEDALSQYPLRIEQETMDTTALMEKLMLRGEEEVKKDPNIVHINTIFSDVMKIMGETMEKNDIVSFKEFLDSNEEMKDLVTDIRYNYNADINIYNDNSKTNRLYPSNNPMTCMLGGWQQLIDNKELLENQYELVLGEFPNKYNELLLILDQDGNLTDLSLYMLGIISETDLYSSINPNGTPLKTEYSHQQLIGLKYKAVADSAYYELDGDRIVNNSTQDKVLDVIAKSGFELEIVGIVKASANSGMSSMFGGIGYTDDLVEKVMEINQSSEVIKAQLANKTVDMLTGLPFEGNVEDAYKSRLRSLGYADKTNPDSINIYPKSFEAKERIIEIIKEYNATVPVEKQIKYTDDVAFMIQSVNEIVNTVSYVLIAFVSVSLIVSSIMIGVITYISVLERTKEIGILRSIGASKKDISRVFNAETLIIGFTAGALGIGISLLLLIPINTIIKYFTEIPNMGKLPVAGGIALIIISTCLTLIAGLIPSRIAAKKDPVIALRSE